MAECKLQAKCWQWAHNERPQTRRVIWHTPNESQRSIVQAAQLQAQGMLPGVVDLHFFYASRLYIIELKDGPNKLSEPQERYCSAMVAQGAVFYQVKSLIKDNKESMQAAFEKWQGIVDAIIIGHPLPCEWSSYPKRYVDK